MWLVEQTANVTLPEVPEPFDLEQALRDHETYEHRIYGNNQASIWAVVDAIDYDFLVRHCWNTLRRPRAGLYLRRAIGENANGQRLRTFTVYLHIEVMKRAGIEPPSATHTIVDHRDGDTLNCRRSNLRWTTPKQNRHNRFGNYYYGFLL